jgi:hypothetical protein
LVSDRWNADNDGFLDGCETCQLREISGSSGSEPPVLPGKNTKNPARDGILKKGPECFRRAMGELTRERNDRNLVAAGLLKHRDA